MDSLPDPQAVMEVPKTSLRRDDWMMTSNSKTVSNLARPTTSSSEDVEALETKAEQQDRNEAEEQDTNESFFSNLGSERKSRKEKLKEKEEMKPDPEKLKISENELNLQLKEGKKIDEYQVEGELLVCLSLLLLYSSTPALMANSSLLFLHFAIF